MRPGLLEFLGPDLKIKTALASLQLFNLGIFPLTPEEVDSSSTSVQRLQADLYCEGNRLFVGGLDPGSES